MAKGKSERLEKHFCDCTITPSESADGLYHCRMHPDRQGQRYSRDLNCDPNEMSACCQLKFGGGRGFGGGSEADHFIDDRDANRSSGDS